MNRKQTCKLIEEIGVVPSVRVSTAKDAHFAAESISQAGIPIVEISMTIPGALKVISDLVRHAPELIVGAGSIMDAETARECMGAGASFLTTDGLILEVVEFARMHDLVVFPGALTPTEIIAAWRAGSDFVKVVPCIALGGENYIRALKSPLETIPLIAAGGVNQESAAGYIAAGATALGVGQALIPREAIALRQANRIRELARRFLNSVEVGRRKNGTKPTQMVVNAELVLASHAD
jgi:2-dehydro-3-deoxyphosphogluconate aldolase/(4S)-4-hydroxy-2-oxoglutarate aldolase